MKKSAVALALSTALAASAVQAETILYGSARVSIDYEKADLLRFDRARDVFDVFDEGVWDIFNNASRLGVRGSEDLGGGLSAIYQYEFAVDVTDGVGGGTIGGNRPKLVGLRSDLWGTAAVGTQWTPYYNVGGIVDVFNSNRSFAGSGAYLGPLRKTSSLVYISPEFMGLTGEVMLQMDGPDGSRDIDSWDAALRYVNGPLFAGVAYTSIESGVTPDGGGRDQWLLGLGYSIMNFGLGFIAEYGDANRFGDPVMHPDTGEITAPGRKAANYYGTASYTFGPNIVRLALGYVDPRGDVEEQFSYALGFQHNLSARTRLWVEYIGSRQDEFEEITDIRFTGDRDAISVGMRHDF